MDRYVSELQNAMEAIDEAMRCTAEMESEVIIMGEDKPRRYGCILPRGHLGSHKNEGGYDFTEDARERGRR